MQDQAYAESGVSDQSHVTTSRLAGPPFESATSLTSDALTEWTLRLTELVGLTVDEQQMKLKTAVHECEDELARRAHEREPEKYAAQVECWLAALRAGVAPRTCIPVHLRANVGRCPACHGSGERCCEFSRGEHPVDSLAEFRGPDGELGTDADYIERIQDARDAEAERVDLSDES